MSEISEIKKFLDGKNNEHKYIVNVETNPNVNYAECIIHEPDKKPFIRNIRYTPFLFIKKDVILYKDCSELYINSKREQYGITITELKTGNQDRLINGYPIKIESNVSYNSIINYIKDGGIDLYEKKKDNRGKLVKDYNGNAIMINSDYKCSVKTTEQFFISTGIRLFKGIDEYSNVHKMIFDIETTGLNFLSSRIFAIGIKDNRNNEFCLTAEKLDDDESERNLIIKFFKAIQYLKPAVIAGYNSENFDFEFILGRAEILKIDLNSFKTTLNDSHKISRRAKTPVKYGNVSDKYTSTNIWGISVIDILHATKRTAAINSDIKEFKLKYIAKLEDIAKPNRTYIDGEDGKIYKFYRDNHMFVCDDNNNYLIVPKKHQNIARIIFDLQKNRSEIGEEAFKNERNKTLLENPDFVDWFRKEAMPLNYNNFTTGKKLLRQYLLDDLWETEQIDNLYNQSSFLVAKITPTTYHRVCTMGTASIWNLLMITWSYENNIAIPCTEKKEAFSGGLARTFKVGFVENWSKIDFASLYPMLQLTYDIFPMFDISGVIKKMLTYLTTTRNIYKKIASGDDLNNEEIELLSQIDHDIYYKYINKTLTSKDRAIAKIKQLPIKILNNSLFGALGSGIAFNWSDNICAARITCSGRVYLRKTIDWFGNYNCEPLLAVTDGVNFKIPKTSKISFDNNSEKLLDDEKSINEIWKYDNKIGIDALIHKFNKTEMIKVNGDRKSYMSVDNDGNFLSCLNLSRINYATKSEVFDKKKNKLVQKIKLTGNTIKSKIMPEYIEEFIDNGLKLILDGDGVGFVDYYNDYIEKLFYKQIPLKKIATKSKIKNTITDYINRGNDKNGKEKGKQAHMELLIHERNKLAKQILEEHKSEFVLLKNIDDMDIKDVYSLVNKYMPPEPELDSVVYHVNIGEKKSVTSSGSYVDESGVLRFNSMIINTIDLQNNPDLTGDYNVVKYLDNFNKRVVVLLSGYEPEIAKRIIRKIKNDKKVGHDGVKRTVQILTKSEFLPSELELKSFPFNSVEETMFLEEKEVEFWNKTGYDPRLIWDGFKMYDNCKVFYNIYEDALNYLNDIMEKNGKKKIKSINDVIETNDYVLIKNGKEYSIGLHNGEYVQIVKKVDIIPQTDEEKLIESKKNDIMSKLNVDVSSEFSADDYEYVLEYLDDFKTRFSIPQNYTLYDIIKIREDAKDILLMFIQEMKNENIYDYDEL